MKLKNRSLLNSLFSFMLAIGLASCFTDVGLGSAIDLTPPEVEVTSHQDNATVPSQFWFEGTAKDNSAVTLITVSIDSENLYYELIPSEGVWKKKNAATSNVLVETEEGSCTLSEDKKTVTWGVYIRTDEGSAGDTSYNVSVDVSDAVGNSSKLSKVDVSLLLDKENPDVIVYNPELQTGKYEDIAQKALTYKLQDGNVISKLFNGNLVLKGRQSDSISFKELRIDFDDGKLETGTRLVTGDSQAKTTVDELAESALFEEETPKIYFSKTLVYGQDGVDDLRNWELSIPQSEWVTQLKNSELLSLGNEQGSGKVIRVVSTSLSDALAWEKKVLGYFVWWPEADAPWINIYSGDDEFNEDDSYPVYPSANLSGTVQDDDGIASFKYSLKKYEAADSEGQSGTWNTYLIDGSESVSIALSEEGATYSAFSIVSPNANGLYEIKLTVKDIFGTETVKTKYFKILDVAPPVINFETPANNSSVLADKNGDITFKGTVTDDGTLNSFSLIYLNPIGNDDQDNIIRYMSGNEAEWEAASSCGTESQIYVYNNKRYTNKIYKIDLEAAIYDAETTRNSYAFEKTLNIFTDLGVDTENKTLINQYFILRAVDNGGTKTVNQIVLAGDTEAPELEIDTLQIFEAKEQPGTDEAKSELIDFSDDNVPTLPVIKNSYYAIITGTWYDNSVVAWDNNTDKINDECIVFEWGDAEVSSITSVLDEETGKWNFTAKLTSLPKTSKPLSATLEDLAQNTKTVSKSIFIETAELGIASIGSLTDDGAYSTGKEIQITVNFTKNTNVNFENEENRPYLLLNNGASAIYNTGSGESQHIFVYTIAAGDSDTNGTLDVTSFVMNGAEYKATGDSGTALGEGDLELPTENDKKLGTSRNIRVDKTAPLVDSLKVISTSGYYNAGKQVLFLLTFNEKVSIENAENLGLTFGTIASPSVVSESSGSNIVVIYTVGAGETSASPLTLSGLTGTSGITVKDEAGNVLSDWDVGSELDKNIYIDTTAPDAPVITCAWGTSALVMEATSFTLSGIEDGATAEYSIDGGANWLTYGSEAVHLSNNGTYQIRARQTDIAGNISSVRNGGSITVEKGYLLSKVTADTVPGTYSVNKGGVVNGRIIFRKDITLPDGAYVTLNVKSSGGTYYTPALTKASSATISGGSDYTFVYTITEGDYIADNAKLDVTAWSFDTVTYDTGNASVGDNGKISVSMAYADCVTGDKKFNANREIYILTGKPVAGSATFNGTVNSDGSVSDPSLSIVFDRNISKATGTIVLSLDGDADSDSFIAPCVISTNKYNSDFDSYYSQGLNGATKNSDSTLTNDTTTKYVLNYSVEPDDSDLVDLFIENGWNKVEIPVVASIVTIDGTTLNINLSGTYKIPVMGAKYKIAIPAGLVSDEVQNTNDAKSFSKTAKGVEAPVIRINKQGQTIVPGATTAAGTVTMPSTASVRIDCQTPGATVYYGKNPVTRASVEVKDSNKVYTTKTDGATVPSASTVYSSAFTLGETVSSYATATGLKVAISALAIKDGVYSSYAYEYAARTALKLSISGGYSEDGKKGYSKNDDGKWTTKSAIKEGDAELKFGELKVWVVGGDSTYGGNSISPFPLSWHDSSNFKLMSGSFSSSSSMDSSWYWVTWDVTTATYHGFVIGDIPSDADTDGPSQWYSGEGGWDSQKSNYILYPGETLVMIIAADSNFANGSFRWCTKNHGER